MGNDQDPDGWARLRFAIIGPLLAAPPQPGELRKALERLAAHSWKHPINGTTLRFSKATVERWYYLARGAKDPVAALASPAPQRCRAGPPLVCRGHPGPEVQYRQYPGWTVQLHYDNLLALSEEDEALGPIPSYGTIRRYLKAQGYCRKRRPKRETPGARQAERRLEKLEVRSYEAEHVHGLWHADFHHGSHQVLTASGRWVTPVAVGHHR